jgi:hypothetical protein
MLERISQFGDLQSASEQFREPLHGFMVHAKQRHLSYLRELLSGSVSLDRITLDREIWHLECQTFVMSVISIYNFFYKDNGHDRLEQLAWERAEELLDAHRRVRKAASLSLMYLRFHPQVPSDVLGIYVYLPNQTRV